MMKRLSILWMSLLAMMPAEASDFVQNAIHYRTLTDSTAVVTGYESVDKDGSDVYIPMESAPNRALQATAGYEVEIPMSVTEGGNSYAVVAIGDNAFLNLYNMTAILLPSTIQSIGSSAFAGCSGLQSITCHAAVPPTAYANSFTSIHKSACTLYVGLHTRSQYAVATGWQDFVNIVEMGYKVTYTVDGELYATDSLSAGSVFIPIAEPTKEGYTFSGWNDCPDVMPAQDVVVTGSFTVNQYTITFDTDGGSEIAPITQDYGTDITAPEAPTQTGYSFVGWDKEIPSTKPAENITIKAMWTINSYKLTYMVDSEVYKEYTIEYNADITPEAEPAKEGYTFSGWSEIPETMPAQDVVVTGSFTVNQYTITFDTDGGSEIAPITQDYGTDITAPEAPTQTGYSFAGWDKEVPSTMPAENITIKAMWTINSYKLTYMVDSEVYKEYTIEYNADITPEPEPAKEGYTFSGWSEILGTMPAQDVVVTGSFTAVSGIESISSEKDNASWYDLSGRKMQTLRQGGLLIRKDKKMIVR